MVGEQVLVPWPLNSNDAPLYEAVITRISEAHCDVVYTGDNFKERCVSTRKLVKVSPSNIQAEELSSDTIIEAAAVLPSPTQSPEAYL